MASSINADNGVVSGSSGLKSTADTSGVLALQSNGSTGLTLNTDLSVTFAGAQTLSAGTANGVTYLNGSKVLTSGSTLSTDGTNLALGGSATAFGSNVSTLLLKGTGATTTKVGALYFKDAAAADAGSVFLQDDSTYGFTAWNSMATGNFFRWAIGALGSEQMRLTTTGLGIGTSSPNRLLSLYATQPVFQITNVASGNTQGTIQYQVSGGTDFILDNQGSGTGGNIIFYQAGVERYRFGTSGQLGVAGANYGTSGQVLTSGGSGSAPTWSTPASGAQAFVAFGSTGGM